MRLRGTTALVALAAACNGRAAPARSPCPADEVIEALHAAAFHLEHGDAPQGRAALVTASSRGRPDALFERLRTQLALATHAEDPDARRRVTEQVRTDLAAWTCLPETLHARFHTRLPALR